MRPCLAATLAVPEVVTRGSEELQILVREITQESAGKMAGTHGISPPIAGVFDD